ncbi:GspH/FimT family pseudopilin [Allochromatium humboldtianum]|uniref:Type II secretion system protein H n=1 Tax=Allochromatium humboldtianum TaxID=504901 RepID=A0A850REE0_9GAMM|nr:GspH/FimT family pseudopilin [Allochromatium humboldtianum]NVZ11335.1 GspH/FimT family pseudopilin [Allochromatium humboldtianum]
MNSPSYYFSANRWAGFGLVELLIVLAILAILATITAPSFTDTFERRRIEGLALAISTDLQFAKAEAIKRNRIVRIVFTTTGHTITIPVSPVITIKTLSYADYANISVSASTGAATIDLSPRLGIPVTTLGITDGVTIAGSGGRSLRVSVNVIGRVSICGTFGGYPTCPS